jgi:hypothetical protein
MSYIFLKNCCDSDENQYIKLLNINNNNFLANQVYSILTTQGYICGSITATTPQSFFEIDANSSIITQESSCSNCLIKRNINCATVIQEPNFCCIPRPEPRKSGPIHEPLELDSSVFGAYNSLRQLKK